MQSELVLPVSDALDMCDDAVAHGCGWLMDVFASRYVNACIMPLRHKQLLTLM